MSSLTIVESPRKRARKWAHVNWMIHDDSVYHVPAPASLLPWRQASRVHSSYFCPLLPLVCYLKVRTCLLSVHDRFSYSYPVVSAKPGTASLFPCLSSVHFLFLISAWSPGRAAFVIHTLACYALNKRVKHDSNMLLIGNKIMTGWRDVVQHETELLLPLQS